MNAALQVICSCGWAHNLNSALPSRRVPDPECCIHGDDARRDACRKLECEYALRCEGLRDQRNEARASVHRYQRSKRKLAELRQKLKEVRQ